MDKAKDKQQGAGTTVENKTPETWGWTRSQRLGLGILVGLLLIFLAIGYWRRPYRIDDGVVVVDGSRVSLPMRIDPNEASAEEIGRIPHVGESLAKKIIDWRDAHKSTAAEGIVFHHLEDLDAVPGVGKKLIEEMKPFLKFPDDASE